MSTQKPTEIEQLLEWLCVEWGFCIPSSDFESIANTPSLTPEQFACLVLEAEGFNPEYEIKFTRQIRDKFTEKFGG